MRRGRPHTAIIGPSGYLPFHPQPLPTYPWIQQGRNCSINYLTEDRYRCQVDPIRHMYFTYNHSDLHRLGGYWSVWSPILPISSSPILHSHESGASSVVWRTSSLLRLQEAGEAMEEPPPLLTNINTRLYCPRYWPFWFREFRRHATYLDIWEYIDPDSREPPNLVVTLKTPNLEKIDQYAIMVYSFKKGLFDEEQAGKTPWSFWFGLQKLLNQTGIDTICWFRKLTQPLSACET